MGDKFYALLLLAASLVHSTLAQCSCGCMRSCGAAIPTANYPPPMPTAMTFPTHHLTGFLPQGFLSQYCQPQAYLPQGMLPPIYQPPAFVMPIPPPPKDCGCANNTVPCEPLPPALPPCAGTYPGHTHAPHHPPIVVQSVYVGRKEEDDEKDKDSGDKKPKKWNNERPERDDDADPDGRRPDRSMSRAAIRRRSRTRMRNQMLSVREDMFDPSLSMYDEPLLYIDPLRDWGDYGGCGGCECGRPMKIVYIGD